MQLDFLPSGRIFASDHPFTTVEVYVIPGSLTLDGGVHLVVNPPQNILTFDEEIYRYGPFYTGQSSKLYPLSEEDVGTMTFAIALHSNSTTPIVLYKSISLEESTSEDDGEAWHHQSLHVSRHPELLLKRTDVPISVPVPGGDRLLWWDDDESMIQFYFPMVGNPEKAFGGILYRADAEDVPWDYSFSPLMGRLCFVEDGRVKVLDFVS